MTNDLASIKYCVFAFHIVVFSWLYCNIRTMTGYGYELCFDMSIITMFSGDDVGQKEALTKYE